MTSNQSDNLNKVGIRRLTPRPIDRIGAALAKSAKLVREAEAADRVVSGGIK